MTPPIKTLLVDDQVLFREAINTVLSLDGRTTVVGEASHGEEAVRMTAQLQPDVVLMDLRMPGMTGTEATRRIRNAFPQIRVLVLTTFDDEEEIFDVLRAGANGYLLKNAPSTQLIDAIMTVAKGESYLQPSVTTRVVAEFNRLSKQHPTTNPAHRILSLLSPRESDIVRMLSRGMSNKEIAVAIGVTEGTVKNHMTSILEKFNAPDRVVVALKAREMGFQ